VILGLATVIYHVPDLSRATAWYAAAFQTQPYFDEPFYVGFNIGGYELGLDPDMTSGRTGDAGGLAYWRTKDIAGTVRHFLDCGAALASDVRDVGGGIKVAAVADPFGNVIGLIENPQFQLV
jgi:predicted enzyme related to lactoylglutathione lyase